MFPKIQGGVANEFRKKKRKFCHENLYRKARKAAGMTQEEAVEYLPFSLRSMQAYEAGKASPKYENVVAMAKVYGCSIDAFSPNETEEGKTND